MSNPLVEAVLRAQLVDDSQLNELKRWGVPLSIPEAVEFDSKEEIVHTLLEAIESHDYVQTRVTDPDVLKSWHNLENQKQGFLVLKANGQRGSSKVTYCFIRGEYIIPWVSDSITDIMMNGDSYLRISVDGKPRKIYFQDCRELFFGDVKAFIACTPSSNDEEESDDDQ